MTLIKHLKVPHIKQSILAGLENEPLRILFCGSDAFSIASLRKLQNRSKIDKSLIASIDVVCRPGKPVGRGLKTIRNVPISETAKELSLPLHEVDTFTGWEPPMPQGMPINLVVAVSFGLFVPPRILGAAKYGGLNVHPSILPDFYGPAPLQHTLLAGSEYTGVTVQTLHSDHFDQGVKLLQHPIPGIKHGCRSVEELTQKLAVEGGDMLVDCIRDRLYLYGSVLPIPVQTTEVADVRQRYAPKIKTADRFIKWTSWTGDEIIRRQQILGPLWSLAATDKGTQSERRIIWSTGFKITSHQPNLDLPIGQPVLAENSASPRVAYVRACDGQILSIDEIKIEGGQQSKPLKASTRADMHDPNTAHAAGPLFRTPVLLTLPEHHGHRQRSPRMTAHTTSTT